MVLRVSGGRRAASGEHGDDVDRGRSRREHGAGDPAELARGGSPAAAPTAAPRPSNAGPGRPSTASGRASAAAPSVAVAL